MPARSALAKSPSTSYFQPTSFALGNHSRRRGRILAVGISSAHSVPWCVENLPASKRTSVPSGRRAHTCPTPKSLTAAAWKTASAPETASRRSLSARSAPVLKLWTLPMGRRPCQVLISPRSSVTWCPAASRYAANSQPSLPVDRFVRRRTWSSGSQVGPAVTTQWRGCPRVGGVMREVKPEPQGRARKLMSVSTHMSNATSSRMKPTPKPNRTTGPYLRLSRLQRRPGRACSCMAQRR